MPGDVGDPDLGNKEDAKLRDLMLDSLKDKLERGEIDARLKKTLDDLKLTPEQAKRILDKADLARAESRGRATGPEQSATQQRVGARTYTGASFEPPAELEGSFRRFRQERAKVGNQSREPVATPQQPAPPK
ncbi:MAG TPA: hypothetical protein PKC45_04815 [Gemmatales bacterium]|nr:hypothetical protein [Gemmatales bacterium]